MGMGWFQGIWFLLWSKRRLFLSHAGLFWLDDACFLLKELYTFFLTFMVIKNCSKGTKDIRSKVIKSKFNGDVKLERQMC